MKNKILVVSLLSLSVNCAVQAQESSADDSANKEWIGAFGHVYGADKSKLPTDDTFKSGDGLGFEYGYKFNESWAVRFELARINLDESSDTSRKESASSLGVDALYFVDQASTYLFTGYRHQNFDISKRLMVVGAGKHWQLKDNWKIITEVAGMHDFGQTDNDIIDDVIAKIGVSYSFGGSTYTAPVDGDSDNDGVVDSRDQCANTPAGMEVDAMGCEIQLDTDNDGVYNKIDECPATPQGVNVDSSGCAVILDNDNDGVFDNVDKCADTPSTDKVDNMGCSILEQKEVSTGLHISFANNSSMINNVDQAQIDEFVAFLQRYGSTNVVIEGHASAPGDATYNLGLSTKRANSARAMFVNKYGIDGSRITTEGFGETQLLDSSNTAAAHKINRRIMARVSTTVEVKVSK